MHDHGGIDRSSVAYWLTGNGQWETRWHCTSHDALLYVVSVIAVAIMFALYVAYAVRNHQALAIVKESHFRDHAIQLRNVFLLCGAIHVANGIINWFVPIYWIIVLMTILNIWQCVLLLISKREILAIQRYTQGEQAIRQVENAMALIHESNRANVSDTIVQLEKLFER